MHIYIQAFAKVKEECFLHLVFLLCLFFGPFSWLFLKKHFLRHALDGCRAISLGFPKENVRYLGFSYGKHYFLTFWTDFVSFPWVVVVVVVFSEEFGV